MSFFLQVVVVGLGLGCIYGLVALGVVVIYSSTRVLNFAQGEFLMLGGLASWWTLTEHHWPWLLGLAAAVVAGSLAGIVVSKVVIATMIARGTDPISMVIGTLAVSIVLSQGAAQLMGPNSRSVPSALPGAALHVGGVVVTQSTIAACAGALLALVVFSWIRSRTRTGLSLRAVGINREGARVVGIRVGRVETIAFALSGAVAGFAGLMITPIEGWTPTMGLDISIFGFIAAIVGGIASPYSAFIGGLLIGIVTSIGQAYLPSSFPFSSSISFAALIFVILVRPSGLFPSLETRAGALRS